jgi:starvation-inducible DNA-binding protein
MVVVDQHGHPEEVKQGFSSNMADESSPSPNTLAEPVRTAQQRWSGANERRTAMEIDTGIPDTARKEIAEGLSVLLADTYTLYLKTHGYHWNVIGPMFRSLHLMFEEQYIELRDAVDQIAERIRALGYFAPSSYSEFAKLTTISDEEGAPEALDMVRRLVEGHDAVIRTARKLVDTAEVGGDVATADLITARIEVHEKTAWMLRATAS